MVGSPPRAVNAALSPVAFSPLADRTNRLIRPAPPHCRRKIARTSSRCTPRQATHKHKPRRSGVCLIAANVGLSGALVSATRHESHKTKSDKQHGVRFGFGNGGSGLQRK